MSKRKKGPPPRFEPTRVAVAFGDGDAIALPTLLEISRELKREDLFVTLQFAWLAGDTTLELFEKAWKENTLCAFGITLPQSFGEHRRVAFNGYVIQTSEGDLGKEDWLGAWVTDYRIKLASKWFIY